MPIYEYRCLDCNRVFEELRKIADKDKIIACPICSNTNTKLQFSAFGIAGGKAAPSGCSKAKECGG